MSKGNPFRVTPMNPMQRFMSAIRQLRAYQQNPSNIGKLLLDNGRIDEKTYEAIKGMNSPSQIGQYLMDNGILGQDQVNELAQSVPHVQSMLNN